MNSQGGLVEEDQQQLLQLLRWSQTSKRRKEVKIVPDHNFCPPFLLLYIHAFIMAALYELLLLGSRPNSSSYAWLPTGNATTLPKYSHDHPFTFISINIVSTQTLHFLASIAVYIVPVSYYCISFLFTKNLPDIKSYIYPIFIHLIILCIGITGNIILCHMQYIISLPIQEPGPQSCSGGGEETKSWGA